MWTGAGILLCILIFVYLSIVARRAVDDELDDDDETPTATENSEERMAFLSPEDSTDLERGRAMAESPFRSHHIVPNRALIPVETDVEGDEDGRWS